MWQNGWVLSQPDKTAHNILSQDDDFMFSAFVSSVTFTKFQLWIVV